MTAPSPQETSMSPTPTGQPYRASTEDYCEAGRDDGHAWTYTSHAGLPRIETRTCMLCRYLSVQPIREALANGKLGPAPSTDRTPMIRRPGTTASGEPKPILSLETLANLGDVAALLHKVFDLRDERIRNLTAEVERMRPVVEAAEAWRDFAFGGILTLSTAVDAYRAAQDAPPAREAKASRTVALGLGDYVRIAGLAGRHRICGLGDEADDYVLFVDYPDPEEDAPPAPPTASGATETAPPVAEARHCAECGLVLQEGACACSDCPDLFCSVYCLGEHRGRVLAAPPVAEEAPETQEGVETVGPEWHKMERLVLRIAAERDRALERERAALHAHGQTLNELNALQRQLATAIEERDLAIAHDRQSYPTADAYESACRALEKHRQRAEKAIRERDEADRVCRLLWDATGIPADQEPEFVAGGIRSMVETARLTRTQLRPQLARAEADCDALRREVTQLREGLDQARLDWQGECDALLTRIAEALGIAPKLAALVDRETILGEANRVRCERDYAEADLADLRNRYQALRAEVGRIANDPISAVAQATDPEHFTTYRQLLLAALAGHGEPAPAHVPPDVVD